ncbi:hypothetical protein W97_05051 [Coniosporium apollinis CBS 100218]|uniref:Uncharacterized protein n=1 Tax=Coniosporium apollinis (strain CBS 100218) TaxID=1168221 RepID=R7YV78_CONA1|nr:uncharacterized protein W97_05051 [Coniosporium apollinis CBS 100218]EON65812.1 hypothetical protein W97_05051 [Coniosporium apollinis CBS 100218]
MVVGSASSISVVARVARDDHASTAFGSDTSMDDDVVLPSEGFVAVEGPAKIADLPAHPHLTLHNLLLLRGAHDGYVVCGRYRIEQWLDGILD